MDSKDLEVAGTFKVLGYELTLDEALTLQMNLSTALNISYGGQHEAPAMVDADAGRPYPFQEIDKKIYESLDAECGRFIVKNWKTATLGKEMDISNAHIPLAPVVDALKAEEANILKHEEWKSGWLKGMAEEMNKLTREYTANASR